MEKIHSITVKYERNLSILCDFSHETLTMKHKFRETFPSSGHLHTVLEWSRWKFEILVVEWIFVAYTENKIVFMIESTLEGRNFWWEKFWQSNAKMSYRQILQKNGRAFFSTISTQIFNSFYILTNTFVHFSGKIYLMQFWIKFQWKFLPSRYMKL